MKSLKTSKNGMSGVIAVSIFLVISVVSIVAFQNWFLSYGQGIFVDVEQRDNRQAYKTQVVSVSESYLYLKNDYDDLDIEEIKIEGIQCNFTNTYSTDRIIKIDVQDCLHKQNLSYGDVTIYTSNGVLNTEHSFKKYNAYPETKLLWSDEVISFNATDFGHPYCTNLSASDGGFIESSDDICISQDTRCQYYLSKTSQYSEYGCVEKQLNWTYGNTFTGERSVSGFGLQNCSLADPRNQVCDEPDTDCQLYSSKMADYVRYECSASYD